MLNKIISLLFVLVLCAACSKAPEPPVQEPKTYIVDFSGDRSLKPLFDSGLRPKLKPGIISSCEIRKQRLSVKFVPDQKPIVMDVEYLSVLVGAEDQVLGFELRGIQKMTLDAAAQEVRQIIKNLDFPPKAQSDLDQWLEKYQGRWTFLPYRGGGKTAHSFITVEIMPSFSKKTPAVIGFFGWREGARDEKSRRVPVVPPPGYEDVSMNYPGNERRGEFTVEDGTSLEKPSKISPKESPQPVDARETPSGSE